MVTVLAHTTLPAESAAVKDLLDDVEFDGPAYVMGQISDSRLDELAETGARVEVVPQRKEPYAARPLLAELAAGELDRDRRYELDVNGPLTRELRDQLQVFGATVAERVPPFGLIVWMTPNDAEQVAALQRVLSVSTYPPESEAALTSRGARPSLEPIGSEEFGEARVVDLLLRDGVDSTSVVATLPPGITVIISGKAKIRVRLGRGVRARDALVRGVQCTYQFVEPTPHLDLARAVVGLVGSVEAGNGHRSGAGQIIAVADTGIDADHPDFGDRIAVVIAYGDQAVGVDRHGHGTHVAGIAIGDGSASEGRLCGAAPGSTLVFQSMQLGEAPLGALPPEIDLVLQDAYERGARIHCNSWGQILKEPSMYYPYSYEIDRFVADHRDMLVVVSAGNSGQSRTHVNSEAGFVDWSSITPPATAKNALTVGASRSARTSGGRAERTHRQMDRRRFPDPPIATDPLSGDPDSLAGFSSRGPAIPLRIKPEIVAPGTSIAAPRSRRPGTKASWSRYPGNEDYAFTGGTSMAAPLVAGAAAIVRQYYVEERGTQPSAALLKATLINGARVLDGDDAGFDDAYPNYHQGFGCLNMPTTIPPVAEPDFALEFVDQGYPDLAKGLVDRDVAQFEIEVAPDQALRACLCWTDRAPGAATANVLDLTVHHLPDGPKWYGNEDRPVKIAALDRVNNVEVVRIPTPPAGRYLIQVDTVTMLAPPQDFALVVTGAVQTPLRPIRLS